MVKNMRIITLVENSKGNNDCTPIHGLSVYIETKKHKLLVDSGQKDVLIENAKIAGVDLSEVDTLILSHGHYDHSGGIIPFSRINNHACIYMNERAGDDYYHTDRYIGIDKDILKLDNLKLLTGDTMIDDEIYVFGGVKERRFYPLTNNELIVKRNGVTSKDDFSHEMYVVIKSEGKSILVSGCAHNGIVNIMNKYKSLVRTVIDRETEKAEESNKYIFFKDMDDEFPNVVISGFHMMRKNEVYTETDIDIMKETAEWLNTTGSIFYTGHCTGEYPYEVMKELMGDKLNKLSCGSSIKI